MLRATWQWIRCWLVVCVVVAVGAMAAAQTKEGSMKQPIVYRTVQLDGL